MKLRLKLTIYVIVVAQIFATAGHAQDLQVTAVPDGLPAEQQKTLQERRAAIFMEWSDLGQKRASYVIEFKGTKTGSPRAAEAARRRAELDAEADRIADEADDFTQAVDIVVRIDSLTMQIKETEKQLQRLGFKLSAEDFEQIKEMSAEDMARLKARLFFRLQGLVREKTTQAMQERFLKTVKTLRPGQIRNIQMILAPRESGVADPVFSRWLHSFQPNRLEAGFTPDVGVLIAYLERENKLGKVFEKLEPDTVEAQQEAAIMLLSLVMYHPYFDELRVVAAGSYDVSEAWFYVAALDMDTAELNAVTDGGLAAQKVLIRQMEDLTNERAMMRRELKKLQTP